MWICSNECTDTLLHMINSNWILAYEEEEGMKLERRMGGSGRSAVKGAGREVDIIYLEKFCSYTKFSKN